MSADLQSLTTPFKRQLADLQSRHASGALSKAQLDHAYGANADNVLTNHRTKLILPSGLSDRSTA